MHTQRTGHAVRPRSLVGAAARELLRRRREIRRDHRSAGAQRRQLPGAVHAHYPPIYRSARPAAWRDTRTAGADRIRAHAVGYVRSSHAVFTESQSMLT